MIVNDQEFYLKKKQTRNPSPPTHAPTLRTPQSSKSLSRVPIKAKKSGSFSPPPSARSSKKGPSVKCDVDMKGLSNHDRLTSILKRVLQLDPSEHKSRSVLLESASLFFAPSEITPDQIELFFEVLISVFSTPPPFSIITKSYKQIYFHPRAHPADVSSCYKLMQLLLPMDLQFPNQLLSALMRRMTSASSEDRSSASECLKMLSKTNAPYLIHLLSLLLCPPPPHGIDDMLKLVVSILSEYRSPPPLFDDFFITNSLDDDAQSVLSITTSISEQRLNDGITIFEELQCTLRLLHFAPHYRTFFKPLIDALKALHEKNEEFARQNRLFILHHWPRLDPMKAVLFMKEGTSICVHGPPIDEFVWQRFAWRSSSIQWQIAMEGLNFVTQTISKAQEFDMSVLRFLLEDAIKTHWHHGVREEAEKVLKLLHPDSKAKPPKTLPVDTWTKISEVAAQNYPGTTFRLSLKRSNWKPKKK